MKKFWSIVNSVVAKSDIILEVLDARFPELTRNEKLEKKIQEAGKTLIYVLNKADLVNLTKTELHPAVILSTKERRGTKQLRDLIKRHATRDPTFVGVIGYPNTGKSSVINVLVGRASAKVAPKSGQTRGLQHIRLTKTIKLIDTPGVLPPEDDLTRALVGAIEPSKLQEPDLVAEDLIEAFPKAIKDHYGITSLEEYAQKHHFLRKGGELDLERAARKILTDWQQGKIPLED